MHLVITHVWSTLTITTNSIREKVELGNEIIGSILIDNLHHGSVSL